MLLPEAKAQRCTCKPVHGDQACVTSRFTFCWQQQVVLADPGNPLLQAGLPGGGAPSGFIRVQGGTFVDDDCNEFLLFGWNRCVCLSLPCTSKIQIYKWMSSPVSECDISASCYIDAAMRASSYYHCL